MHNWTVIISDLFSNSLHILSIKSIWVIIIEPQIILKYRCVRNHWEKCFCMTNLALPYQTYNSSEFVHSQTCDTGTIFVMVASSIYMYHCMCTYTFSKGWVTPATVVMDCELIANLIANLCAKSREGCSLCTIIVCWEGCIEHDPTGKISTDIYTAVCQNTGQFLVQRGEGWGMFAYNLSSTTHRIISHHSSPSHCLTDLTNKNRQNQKHLQHIRSDISKERQQGLSKRNRIAIGEDFY